MFSPRKIIEKRLLAILSEDVGEGDVTTSVVVPADLKVEASVLSKEKGIVAGIEEGRILLESLGIEVEASLQDGAQVRPGQSVIKMHGDARTILTVERTLLNLVSRMSGIATATRNLVDQLRKAKLKSRIACTRKTAPGLLYFDKKAVEIGGGDTHRLHLDDMILIKDNHLTVAGNVVEAVKKARAKASFSKKIEVEVTKGEDVIPAIESGADIVMLDNFSPAQIRRVVESMKKANMVGAALLEASGGITSKNMIAYASTGVDLISMGELTQSSRALNMSLELSVKRPKH